MKDAAGDIAHEVGIDNTLALAAADTSIAKGAAACDLTIETAYLAVLKKYLRKSSVTKRAVYCFCSANLGSEQELFEIIR